MHRPNNLFLLPFFVTWQRIKTIALTPIDIRDIFYFAGMGALGYGIHMIIPWLAFVVCGLLLMLTGYVMGAK